MKSPRNIITQTRRLITDVRLGLVLAGWSNDSLMQRVTAAAPVNGEKPWDMPWIVCLCGSSRFSDAFRQANLEETLAGHIVLSIGCDTKSDAAIELSVDTKLALDRLHLRKIELADEVIVLNVGGYVGESTRAEIRFAVMAEKPIRWLESQHSAANIAAALEGAP